jgi:two-component sensor histidine kinase
MTADSDVLRFPLIEPGASDLTGLMAVVRRLSSAKSQPEIITVITQAARALLQADGITFVLRDGIQCHYVDEDAISPLWKGRRFPMSACISGWCMTEAKPAVIPDIRVDARIPQDAYRPTFVRSLAMVPVRQDDPVAAVGAYWSKPREIAPKELELLQAIANLAAMALGNVTAVPPARSGQSGPSEPREKPNRSLLGRISQRLLRSPGPFVGSTGWLFRDPATFRAASFAIVAVSLATFVRLWAAVVIGPGIVPFAIYFPAILISALAAGLTGGLVALVYGSLLAWVLFVPETFDLSFRDVAQMANIVLFVASSALLIWMAEICRSAVRSLRQEQAQRMLLTSELRHRMRNSLAVVQAIVSQSLKHDPGEALKISGRISALIAGTDQLAEAPSGGADVRRVVEQALAPYGPSRMTIEGGDVLLPPDQAQVLALVVHELATNAAKYGALATPDGRLHVTWSVGDHLTMVWSERGGPGLAPPRTTGFGTSFVGRILDRIGGTIDRQFGEAGLVCTITLPSRGEA